jgi:rhamnosyltransferase
LELDTQVPDGSIALIVGTVPSVDGERLLTLADVLRRAGCTAHVHCMAAPVDDQEFVAWKTLVPEATWSFGDELHTTGWRALVVVGLSTALVVLETVQEEETLLPLWLDLAGFPQALDFGEPALGDVFGFWHNCARILDLGDGYSVATPGEARTLHHQLGLRGRFRTVDEARQGVLVLDSTAATEEAEEVLGAWLCMPRRLRRLLQLPGSAEQKLRTMLEDTVHQLESIHHSKMWSFWMWTLAVRRWFSRSDKPQGLRRSHRRGFFRSRQGSPSRRPTGLSTLWQQWSSTLWKRVCLPVYCGVASGMAQSLLLLRGGAVEFRALFRRSSRKAEIPRSPEGENVAEAHRPRVLIVSPYSIYPTNHGGGVRLFNLVKQMGKSCDLFLLVFIQGEDDPAQREALEAHCERVYFHHWKPSFKRPPWSSEPPNVLLFASHRVELMIRDLLARHRIEILQLEYTELGQYHRVARDDVRVILVEHDICFRSFRRRLSLGFHHRFPDSRAFGASRLDGLGMMTHEVAVAREVDQIHVMSPQDGAFLSSYLLDGVERLRVVPNAVDTEFYRPPSSSVERRGVLLVGNFQNLPNMDAFEFFVEEIWPRLRRLEPAATLAVVGAKMPPSMDEWDGRDGIEIVGAVPEMRSSYHRYKVLACPIRAGSGTRLKLLEAFAAGIPSVSTAIAAEGLQVEDGIHLLLAEEPDDFAAALVRLLNDDALCARLAQEAIALVTEHYDWSASAESNLRSYQELLSDAPVAKDLGDRQTESAGGRTRPGGEGPEEPVEVSIILPTLNGGKALGQTLDAILRQKTSRRFEVLCVDSGSVEEDLVRMRQAGVRIHSIRKEDFNHGLTRDLGASLTQGEFLVFLNQDAVPRDASWLEDLLSPFGDDPQVAAVQGGMLEFPHDSGVRRFFWDSCGERFYFTRESTQWIERFEGVGFSTVNAAMRRVVWQEIPFGWAPIMEDKKWQREAMERGYRIVTAWSALVHHTHDYNLRSLGRRCRSEGYGWHLLGETYRFSDLIRDSVRPRLVAELLRGISQGRVRKIAEVVFPWYRPWMLWVGNRWSRRVEH